jgi:dihydroxyacid dehydratase/phosphogluconate dehydratase
MDARTNIEDRRASRHVTEGPARAQAGLFGQADIFKKTPDVADLKPRGRHLAADMHQVTDIPLLMKTLLDTGHLHGDCTTVTGRTIAEDLKSVKPMAAIGGAAGLQGNGATVKAAGMSNFSFAGLVRGFDAEAGTINAKLTGAALPERRTKWKSRETNHKSGALWKDAQQVGPAVGGAVTHPGSAHEKQCYADM